jgi:nitroimidazol reductase NimA-like FMN-containing flavoprotein (pyridoxamine 5'-phosphate oxidase superfamily)
MENDAIRILNKRRTMAISTVRPDGWPQTTIVGYANDGLLIYFMIFRSSQKFANIDRDQRISIAVGEEPAHLGKLQAVFASALACEVTDPDQRREAWKLLSERHPNLAEFDMPERKEAAVMRAQCKHVSVLDYTKGYGHADAFTVGADGVITMDPPHVEPWGSVAAKP